MPGRVAEAAVISALATALTLAIAAPVLRAPSERLFGHESAGRHHDPFTAMEQFTRPIARSVHQQPMTDVPGALLARALHPVAASNALVLLTFPLSAAAAYALGRHLALPPVAAGLAALAFAFSPFHLAHAAYHPHVAQTQWIPLYLLALWRCLGRASAAAVAGLVVAAAAVTLSNFYGGLIALVISPAAILAYWLANTRRLPGSGTSLAVTVATLGAVGVGGLAVAAYAEHMAVVNRAALAVPRDDLLRYGATWWSYLAPPIEHPVVGPVVARLWHAAGVREGLLEQQVSVGWGLVVLGVIAVHAFLVRGADGRGLHAVPALASVAAVALVCSLSPLVSIGPVQVAGVPAILHPFVPMFRAYARFGVVVQLMAALLAAIGAGWLWARGTRGARTACVALVLVTCAEYAVRPSAMWRHALPTEAHRWLLAQRTAVHALDCAALTPESASIPWLTAGRIMMRDAAFPECGEPNIGASLSAAGYTHLVVRRDTRDAERFFTQHVPEGLRVVARLADGDVFAVAAQASPVYTLRMSAFHAPEHDGDRIWRWMGPAARWTIVNPGGQPVSAILNVEIMAFAGPRRLGVAVDGAPVQTLLIEGRRRVVPIGPLVLRPGRHELVFQPLEPPKVADEILHNRDRRPLSFAMGGWRWTTAADQQ